MLLPKNWEQREDLVKEDKRDSLTCKFKQKKKIPKLYILMSRTLMLTNQHVNLFENC